MKIRDKRCVVTGGAGFIGSHLVDQLLARGNRVTVLDDFASGSRANLAHHKASPDLEIIEGDVRNAADVARAFRGADVVFHLATHCVRLSLTDPWINHDVNATGTMCALVGAKAAGVARFVYCSSSEVFGNGNPSERGDGSEINLSEKSLKEPATVYGASKLVGEHYALAFHHVHGLRTVVARPFNAFGPRSHFKGAYGEVIPRFAIFLRAGQAPTIFGDGSHTRDFTYVEDTAAGLIEAAECDELLGDTVNIASGRSVSVGALVKMLSELTGSKVKPRHLAARPGDVHHLKADTRKAARLLSGWTHLGFRDGLVRYLAWLDAQGLDYARLARELGGENWKDAA